MFTAKDLINHLYMHCFGWFAYVEITSLLIWFERTAAAVFVVVTLFLAGVSVSDGGVGFNPAAAWNIARDIYVRFPAGFGVGVGSGS